MIPINLNLDRHVDNEKTRGNLSIDYQFTEVTNSPIKTPSHKDSLYQGQFALFRSVHVHPR